MSEVDLTVQYYNELFVTLIFALAAVFFVNVIPGLSYFFDLFFVMIHELGHVIMTAITSGVTWGFRVFSDKSGVASRDPKNPGSAFWIIPAGYVGVSIFSTGLILLAGFPQFAPYVAGSFGILLLLFVAAHGKQSKPEGQEYQNKHVVTALVGTIFSVGMIGIAFFAHASWSVLFLTFLGLEGAYVSLKALKDLALQVRINQVDPEKHKNIDPIQMAKLFSKKIPLLSSPMFWVRTWSLLSILLLFGAIWFTWLRNMVLVEPV